MCSFSHDVSTHTRITAVANYCLENAAQVCNYMRREDARPDYSRFLSPSGNHLFLPLSDLKGEGADEASASAITPKNKLLMHQETERLGGESPTECVRIPEVEIKIRNRCPSRGFRTTSKIAAGEPPVIHIAIRRHRARRLNLNLSRTGSLICAFIIFVKHLCEYAVHTYTCVMPSKSQPRCVTETNPNLQLGTRCR